MYDDRVNGAYRQVLGSRKTATAAGGVLGLAVRARTRPSVQLPKRVGSVAQSPSSLLAFPRSVFCAHRLTTHRITFFAGPQDRGSEQFYFQFMGPGRSANHYALCQGAQVRRGVCAGRFCFVWDVPGLGVC